MNSRSFTPIVDSLVYAISQFPMHHAGRISEVMLHAPSAKAVKRLMKIPLGTPKAEIRKIVLDSLKKENA